MSCLAAPGRAHAFAMHQLALFGAAGKCRAANWLAHKAEARVIVRHVVPASLQKHASRDMRGGNRGCKFCKQCRNQSITKNYSYICIIRFNY